METVSQFLHEKKNKDLNVISPDATVYDALLLMADKNIGAVLVIESGKLLGLFSERDYARKVVIVGKSSQKTLVKEIMTTDVQCVTPTQTIEQCMVMMTTKYIRHLPVIENEKIIGIISIGDVVRVIIEDQKYVINQLEHFITR